MITRKARVIKSRKFTSEYFLVNARLAWGDRFDYSETNLLNPGTLISIRCREHGTFKQSPYSHVKHIMGCKECAKKDRYDKYVNTFISNSKAVWGDQYDYSSTSINKAQKTVTLRCKKHGVFTTKIKKHLLFGCGCPTCFEMQTTKEFIDKSKAVWGCRWSYQKTKFSKVTKQVTLTCRDHGDFEQSVDLHLSGKCGCKKCRKIEVVPNKRITPAQYISKANAVHQNKYNYQNCFYTPTLSKLTVTCPIHGDFEVSAKKHLTGTGCFFCTNSDKDDKQHG